MVGSALLAWEAQGILSNPPLASPRTRGGFCPGESLPTIPVSRNAGIRALQQRLLLIAGRL